MGLIVSVPKYLVFNFYCFIIGSHRLIFSLSACSRKVTSPVYPSNKLYLDQSPMKNVPWLDLTHASSREASGMSDIHMPSSVSILWLVVFFRKSSSVRLEIALSSFSWTRSSALTSKVALSMLRRLSDTWYGLCDPDDEAYSRPKMISTALLSMMYLCC